MKTRSAMFFVFVLMTTATLFAADAPQRFHVAYVGGPLRTAGSVELTVTSDALVVSKQSKHAFLEYRISLDEITNIVHSPTRFSRSRSVGSAIGWMFQGGSGDPVGQGGLAMLGLTLMAITGPMHGKDHYISVTWEHEGVEQELLVNAPKDQYAVLIAELARVSGRKFVDFEAVWREFHDELEHRRNQAFAASLDRHVRVGDAKLPPGTYNLLLLPHQDGQSQLYFFAGEVRDVNLKAVAPVEVVAGTPGANAAEITYSQGAVPAQILEVRTPQNTMKLLSATK